MELEQDELSTFPYHLYCTRRSFCTFNNFFSSFSTNCLNSRSCRTAAQTSSSIKNITPLIEDKTLKPTPKTAAPMSYAAAIIEFSNVTPFRTKIGKDFYCHYGCRLNLSPDAFREHNRTHHANDRLKLISGLPDNIVKVDIEALLCTLCSEPISKLDSLECHLKTVHNKHFEEDFKDIIVPFKLSTGTYECQMCSETFPDLKQTDRHMHSHFRRHICETCGAGMMTKTNLRWHNEVHKKGSFPCKVCGKVFASAMKRRLHTNTIHKGVPRHGCPECPERFKEYYQKTKHLVEVHNQKAEQYICKLCGKEFVMKQTLKLHERRYHLLERNHHCSVCGQTFFLSTHLKDHMVTHTGERSFECGVCKKTYGTKRTLVKHIKIHDGDKKFPCHICGHTLAQKNALKTHMSTQHPSASHP